MVSSWDHIGKKLIHELEELPATCLEWTEVVVRLLDIMVIGRN